MEEVLGGVFNEKMTWSLSKLEVLYSPHHLPIFHSIHRKVYLSHYSSQKKNYQFKSLLG